ncbi:MAG: hypothetical protein QXK06_00125 [Candidatus Diapherotrites archaeon]
MAEKLGFLDMLKKHKRRLIVLVAILFAIFFVIWFLGIPVGFECGRWNAFSGIREHCDCLGIKTGHCPLIALCDGGRFGCIGLCSNCKCQKSGPEGISDIPCENG